MATFLALVASQAIVLVSIVRGDGEKQGTGKFGENAGDVGCALTTFLVRYWGMHDVMDEALQRLYWACREGRGFPGVVPDESSGRVATDAILRGLGLDPPAVERAGPIKSQSEPVLDSKSLRGQRSYQPPDIPPRLAPRPSRQLSDQTPLSPLGPADLGDVVERVDGRDGADGVDGVDGASDSDEMNSVSQGMEADHQTGGIPATRSQGFHPSPDDRLDASMLLDGNIAMMNLQSPMYSQMTPMGFQSTPALGRHTSQAPMQTTQRQPTGIQANVFAPGSQAGWTAERTGVVDGDTLPWPGNLAAVYPYTQPPPAGSGFDAPNHPR
ncbi:hypothetical protein RBB50_010320 [Rhinocladiella similis]